MTIPSSSGARNPTPFRYSPATVQALRRSISPQRVATYLKLASGDRHQAFQLYTRNAAVGASFHGPLQAVEITLRNGVHNAMAAAHGTSWFDGPLLKGPEQEAVGKATKALRRERKPRTPGDMVAALNFGFWVALFKKTYDATLWRTVLYRSFEPVPPRSDLHQQLDRLRTLRNRIVHHEPILQRDLHADHDGILWVLRMLSPETAAWVEHHSRVREELARSSHSISRF